MIAINDFLLTFLIIFIFGSVADIIIDIINALHLKKNGTKVPPVFAGLVDEAKLKDISSYTADNTGISVFKDIVSIIFFLVIILFGFLPWINSHLSGLNFFAAGLIFFAVPGLITSLIDLPFDYYHVFVIEEKYGFNTGTFRIWISDLIKSAVISLILGGILLSVILAIVEYGGSMWWLWAWIIFTGFQLLMTVLYPAVIAPLFNKFTPIENKELEDAIRILADREGIPVTGIFQMDAGKRSRHTNAYFSGLGKSKRIVLYDTLINSHDKDEILGVLAHEMGHMKMGHIRKQFILIGIISLLAFFIADRMLRWELIYTSFGFTETPSYAGLFLMTVIWGPVGFLVTPIFMAISRKYEREADRFALKTMGSAVPLISALKKMAVENLSNLCPHPVYVRFNYSHPPITERIGYLEKMDSRIR